MQLFIALTHKNGLFCFWETFSMFFEDFSVKFESLFYLLSNVHDLQLTAVQLFIALARKNGCLETKQRLLGK